MTPADIITAYRSSAQDDRLLEIQNYFAFKPAGPIDDTGDDENLDFRTTLTQALLQNFSLADIHLIRDLFKAELDCEKGIWRHDNLYQLSFYLYSLGQLEDVFLLYKSKYDYDIVHMDASTMQDQYFLTVGHEPDVVIDYVEKRFMDDPELRDEYPELLAELQSIRDDQEQGTISEYTTFIRNYFLNSWDN